MNTRPVGEIGEFDVGFRRLCDHAARRRLVGDNEKVLCVLVQISPCNIQELRKEKLQPDCSVELMQKIIK